MAQQTAVEWLNEKLISKGILFEYELLEQAKAMEKEQIIKAINEVSENNVKYANMIIASWSQIEGELFMHNTKLAEQYYNDTYNK
jgi:uncharacterized metal-binding protein